MRKALTYAVLALTSVSLLSVAVARPPYRLQAISQFGLVADRGETRTVGCTYCHVNANGGAPWNPFGDSVRGTQGADIGTRLYEALKAMKDSDGDGYADVLEVFAGTEPGNPNSKPLATADALMDRLTKAGGVDAFKPK